MENKNVGMLIIGLSVIIGIIVWIFNNALTTIVSTSCSHGPSCSMYGTIKTQTYISIAIVAIIFIIGIVIMLTKPKEKIIFKKEKIRKKEINLQGLDKKEKQVIEILIKEKAVFQADLMEKIGVGKVGLTRLLDKLESKQLIERKRRGMNNIIVLKD